MYTSETLALAALELLVHVDPQDVPADLVATPATIPDGATIVRLSADRLPRNWRTYPAPETLATLGADWLAEQAAAVLAVPSAVIPSEWNYLLNPAHHEFRRIRIGAHRDFAFDQRLVRGLPRGS